MGIMARPRALARKFSRLGRVFTILLAAATVAYFLIPNSAITLLLVLATLVTGAVVLLRLVLAGLKKLIWRLRNRLLVAYLFIAVVPVVLILILVGVGVFILSGQISTYLVLSELERRTHAVLEPAQGLVDRPADAREERVRWLARYFRTRLPGFEMLARVHGADFRQPETASISWPPPGWRQASGLVLKNGSFYLWAHMGEGESELVMLAPLSREALSRMVPGLGDVSLVSPHRLTAAQADKQARRGRIVLAPKDLGLGGFLPPAASRFDREVFYLAPVAVSLWDSPGESESAVLVIHTRYSAILRTVFSQKLDWGEGLTAADLATVAFSGTAILFLLVELFSLFIGIRLTRTITGAVHNLYEGTQRVQVGDFSHRIETAGGDQLGELSNSFNRMTENLERLLAVAKEKERLQSEIEIAREVQNQLYPKTTPASKTLELAATCSPARMVSGDYYDYLNVQDSRLALAIGDVAGKGISAALLMATVQASLRTYLHAGQESAPETGEPDPCGRLSTAALISRLNQQIYAFTSAEKFATFCLALYDDANGRLTYTNAGHPPPMLFRDGSLSRLEVNGTVVGAFPFSRYEESTLDMLPGDLLVFFTDGVTEPENEYGEMFGEERLASAVARNANLGSAEIIAAVVEAVHQWTGSPELQDDMTLLLARRVLEP